MKPHKSFSLIKILFLLLGFVGFAQAMYNPATGSFLSRDPIEERGGENLYGFVRNDGVGQWDLLGMAAHILIVFDSNNADDAGVINTLKANVAASNGIAVRNKKSIEGMSDEEFKKKTKNGIIINWYLDEDGSSLNPAMHITMIGLKRADFLKWIDHEAKSSVDHLQAAQKLNIGNVEQAAKKIIGHPDYDYNSFGLIIHGLPKKGVLLGTRPPSDNRDTHANAQNIVNASIGYRSKSLISCGAPPSEAFVQEKFRLHMPLLFDDDECKLNYTPAQIGKIQGGNGH